MNVPEFQARWRASTLSEKASAQSHFLDVCELVNHQKPAELDPVGAFFTFEKSLGKTGGGAGFADVWYRGRFAWEYKRPGEDLDKAYRQLKLYAEALENPPLLIVSDIQRIVIHTNWTNSVSKIYEITLDGLSEAGQYGWLRAAFFEPDLLKPKTTPEAVTKEAAERVATIARSLHQRGEEPARVAHFLVQLLFCLFAEDVGLLPRGLFGRTLAGASKLPERFTQQITMLLEAMRDGGFFGADPIAHFNGGLFATIDPIPLTVGELTELAQAAKLDWGNVEPAIFGTLFERSLDPQSRAQLGAHYTGKQDILRVVEPVVMTPLRRRWDDVRAQADQIREAWQAAATPRTRDNRRAEFAALLNGFKEELKNVTVLDPACGSGNFLYVTLAKLLDLEKEVLVYGAANGLPMGYPLVSPAQLYGLEINAYARELAQVVVWIGYLQWKIDNGFPGNDDPILKPLDTIKLQDALLDLSDPEHPKEAEWPKADFIIGNPPFLGGNKVRQELGDRYVNSLFHVFDGRVPAFADLCCYFFEKARTAIERGSTKRSGLLATNSIRGGANREVLKRIKNIGDIFYAWSDEAWILDGAAVRISIVAFDNGEEAKRQLDGKSVAAIHADLTAETDITIARSLGENKGIGFMGTKKGGPFEISEDLAEKWNKLPINANGRPNSDVLRPWANGLDITRRARRVWIIDFGVDRTIESAAMYQEPFEYVHLHCKLPRSAYAKGNVSWWLHERPRPDLRAAISGLNRILVTPRVAKHRLFVWLSAETLPDSQLIVFARQDDYFFGVLHSRAHEVWSLRMGTWLGVGNDPRYTPTTCFETFPLPWPPGQEAWRDPRVHAIAQAARALDAARTAWLNPPDADEATLKKRTLTNLYNQRPTWLAQLHAALDRAVWSAYEWDDPDPAEVPEDEILARLLALNLERAGAQ
jgi:type II restriction/modification system DNA methylase subunit YeeA